MKCDEIQAKSMIGSYLAMLLITLWTLSLLQLKGQERLPSVDPTGTTENIETTTARFLRMTITGTNRGEPGVDEVEVYGPKEPLRNIALLSEGSVATASSEYSGHSMVRHVVSKLNDGQYGNHASWVADTDTAWIQLEFPSSVEIDRIVWSRDRLGFETTRTPTDYTMEVSIDGKAWSRVASSERREPFKETRAGNGPRHLDFPPIQPVKDWTSESLYQIDQWHAKDGLPSENIRAIAQTSDGFLWLGGEFGVARFDGREFTIIRPDATAGQNIGPVVELLGASDGSLWLSSFSGQFGKLQGNRFLPKKGDGGVIFKLLEDNNGRIWGAAESGLFSIAPDAPEVSRLDTDEVSRLLAIDRVGAVYYGRFGHVREWTSDGSKLLMESGTGHILQSAIIAPRKQQDGIWMLDREGHLRASLPNALTTLGVELPFQIAPKETYPLLEDDHNNLWLAVNNDGIYRLGLNGTCERFPLNRESSGRGGAQVLFKDKEGDIWAGGQNCGLFRIRKRNVDLIRLGEQPASVISVSGSAHGELFAVDRLGHSYQLDHQKGRPLELPPSFCLAPGEQANQFWLAPMVWEDESVQLWHRDESGNFSLEANWMVPGERVSSFERIGIGKVVFGMRHHLGHYNNGVFKHGIGAPSPRLGQIKWLTTDQHGRFWVVGEPGKLRMLDGESYSTASLPTDKIRAPIGPIKYHQGNALWIGTLGEGLWLLQEDHLVSINERFGFPAKFIRAIVSDGARTLMVATNNGFYHMNLDSFSFNDEEPDSALKWTFISGNLGWNNLQVTMEAQPNAWLTSKGTAYFATNLGVAVIEPGGLSSLKSQPSIVIDEIQVDNIPVTLNRNIDLRLQMAANSGEMLVRPVVAHLPAPDNVRIQHLLKGHDKDWRELNPERIIRYKLLPKGNYELQLRAAIGMGPWQVYPKKITLLAEAPFWTTRWFRFTLAGFSMALMVGGGGLLWVHSLRKKLDSAQHVQTVERERARIASDMHDRLGGNLTHLGIMVRQLGETPDEILHRRLRNTIDASARNLDEIVWAIDPSKDTFESLIAYCMNLVDESRENSDIRWHMETPENANGIPVNATMRHELFLSVNEAMNNILKHSKATEAWMRIQLNEGKIEINIKDNGCGMTSNEQHSGIYEGNGLKSMRNRMARIGGTFEMYSPNGQGTQIRFVVPQGTMN